MLVRQEVAAADPVLWDAWSAYAAQPDAPPPPVEVSDLIVRMAPHVSGFIARLFFSACFFTSPCFMPGFFMFPAIGSSCFAGGFVSAANAEPDLPITTMAVIKGPSSLVMATATRLATNRSTRPT